MSTTTLPGPPVRRAAAREPNRCLAVLVAEAGLTRKALARRVRDALAAAGEPCPSLDHTYVARWLSGMQPRPATATAVAAVLGVALARRVTTAEAGFTRTGPDVVPVPDLTRPELVPPAVLHAELAALRSQVDRLSTLLSRVAS